MRAASGEERRGEERPEGTPEIHAPPSQWPSTSKVGIESLANSGKVMPSAATAGEGM